jgi:hypothetical protein
VRRTMGDAVRKDIQDPYCRRRGSISITTKKLCFLNRPDIRRRQRRGTLQISFKNQK